MVKVLAPFIALCFATGVCACGGGLADAKGDFRKGRYAEAKAELLALEVDERTWDDQRRCEYALYRGSSTMRSAIAAPPACGSRRRARSPTLTRACSARTISLDYSWRSKAWGRTPRLHREPQRANQNGTHAPPPHGMLAASSESRTRGARA